MERMFKTNIPLFDVFFEPVISNDYLQRVFQTCSLFVSLLEKVWSKFVDLGRNISRWLSPGGRVGGSGRKPKVSRKPTLIIRKWSRMAPSWRSLFIRPKGRLVRAPLRSLVNVEVSWQNVIFHGDVALRSV